MGDIVVGAYYRPSDEEEEADEAFYGKLGIALWSQALVLLGTSTTLVFVGRTTWSSTHGPGNSCRSLKIIF